MAEQKGRAFSFGIREILLLITIVGISLGWIIDRSKSGIRAYDVPGPLTVQYTVQSNADSSYGQTLTGMSGLKFIDGKTIIVGPNNGKVIPNERLLDLSWQKE